MSLRIHANSIKLNLKERKKIEKINSITQDVFQEAKFIRPEAKIFFLPEEEYYSYLGYEKPYRKLKRTKGFYDREYREVYIRLNSKNIVKTYVHELGHYIDYNIKTHEDTFNVGSAFTRKILSDIPFEDQLLKDIKSMPAYTLLKVASGEDYLFQGDEVFARIFEAFIWEQLGRRFFTPDLYIHTPRLFLYLNDRLKTRSNELYKRVHHYLLRRSINRNISHDPFKKDKFSKYIFDLISAI